MMDENRRNNSVEKIPQKMKSEEKTKSIDMLNINNSDELILRALS